MWWMLWCWWEDSQEVLAWNGWSGSILCFDWSSQKSPRRHEQEHQNFQTSVVACKVFVGINPLYPALLMKQWNTGSSPKQACLWACLQSSKQVHPLLALSYYLFVSVHWVISMIIIYLQLRSSRNHPGQIGGTATHAAFQLHWLNKHTPSTLTL